MVATGSTPWVPNVPGLDNEKVISAVDLLNGKVDANGKIAVIGGGLVGAETANHLATHFNDVTIIEMLDEIAREEPGNIKKFLMESFEEHDVDIHTGTQVKSLENDGTIKAVKNGEDIQLGAFDYIVTAVGMRPRTELKDALTGGDQEVIFVGDASEPGNALSAIADGYEKALSI